MKPNRFRFRAWDKERKKMVGIAEIKLLSVQEYLNDKDEIEEEIYEAGQFSTTEQAWYDWPNDKRVVIMQSTGYADKNDKEIFEGDILSADVVRGGGGGRRRFSPKSKPYIIGNIYENPELDT